MTNSFNFLHVYSKMHSLQKVSKINLLADYLKFKKWFKKIFPASYGLNKLLSKQRNKCN